jgi:hypothetical protein
MERLPALKKYLLISLVLGVFLTAAYYSYRLNLSPFETDAFEKAKWQQETSLEESFSCYRGGMASDIKNNKLTTSMQAKHVVDLLGKPDTTTPNKQEIQYILGMCSGFGVDYDVLHIYFNERGELTNAQIIQH